MDQKALLLPTNDFVFKKVFGENMLVLADFLKAVLDIPADEYQGLEVLNPHLLPEHIEDKHCILDIKLHSKSGRVIDIEIQIKKQEYIWKRIQYYTARLLAEQPKSGENYDRLAQVISILVADFILIENKQAHHCFKLYDEQEKICFQDSMEIHVLEIPKASKTDSSHLNNWIRFFQAKKAEEFEMLAQSNPAIAQAWGVIKVLSGDERERAIAEAREKGRMDMLSSMDSERRAGRQEGQLEGKLEVARNALRENMPVATISKLTGLSLDEIQELAACLRKD